MNAETRPGDATERGSIAGHIERSHDEESDPQNLGDCARARAGITCNMPRVRDLLTPAVRHQASHFLTETWGTKSILFAPQQQSGRRQFMQQVMTLFCMNG